MSHWRVPVDATTPITAPAEVPDLLRRLAEDLESGTAVAGLGLLISQHVLESLSVALPASPEIQQVYTLAEYIRLQIT